MNRNQKTIGMVLDGPFPPDVRVEKEMAALTSAGYRISLFALSPKSTSTKFSNEMVDIIYASSKPRAKFAKYLNLIIDKLFHVNYSLLTEIRDFLRNPNLAAIHVHDLIIAGTVFAARPNGNIPIIVDLHENMPAALKVWRPKGLSFKKFVMFFLENYTLWSRYEGRICRQAYGVITVVDEMKQLLIKKHAISSSKIAVIGNTETLAFLDNSNIDEQLVARLRENKCVVYTGGIGPHRGIHTVIEAVALLKDDLPEVKFIIVGSGEDAYVNSLKEFAKRLKVEKQIIFEGWKPFTSLYSYLEGSMVGIIPHCKNEHTDNTIPHKLFQYIIAKIPVLTSDCDPLKRITNELKAGKVFKSEDPKDLAEVLTWQLSHMESFQAVTNLGEFTWEADGRRLVKFYDEVIDASS